MSLASVNLTEHGVSYANGSKTIVYDAAGPSSGPLVILIHGWPGIGKTWYHQIRCLSNLGFRVVAPDMPGYGRSTATKNISDYSQESIVEGLHALIGDTGRDSAVWIGHDWGAGCVSSFVKHYPGKCRAVVLLSVPYHVLELGLDALVKTVNRDIYPADKYPWGQWGYQAYYEKSFDAATAWFDSNPAGFLKAGHCRRPHTELGAVCWSATVVEVEGWMGGKEKSPRPPPPESIPDSMLVMEKDILEELTTSMQKNSFFGPDAYYANHQANHAFNTDPTKVKNDAVLEMPLLFIQGKYDGICDTAVSRLAEPQRTKCRNLTEVNVDCGHFIHLEEPEQVNAAIVRFLVEKIKGYWPGYWSNPFVENRW